MQKKQKWRFPNVSLQYNCTKMTKHARHLVIAVDGRCLSGHVTGIGHYTVGLMRLISTIRSRVHFLVVHREPLSAGHLLQGLRWTSVRDKQQWSLRMKPGLWMKMRGGLLLQRWKPDIFLASCSLTPWFLPKGCQVLAVIYDLVHRLYPETMGWGNRLLSRAYTERNCADARTLIAISRGTAKRFVEYGNRSPDVVIHPRLREGLTSIPRSDDDAVLAQYNIVAPYFLAVGTIEPRKNLRMLIEAYQIAREHCNNIIPLVIVGKNGWGAALPNGSDLSGVIFTGYVSDHHIPALMRKATAFLMPSLYEGFGMPVAEAVASGIQPHIANVPELIEASLGQAVVHHNLDEWVCAIEELSMFNIKTRS